LFLISFGAFFYYFKLTFFSGFGVVVLAIISQTLIAKWLGRI